MVVPVYNPGQHIHPLIRSLHRQSLHPHQFEAIFVDDGSSDGTEVMLDRLCAATPHFRVIHIPNSGWPGRPRNVGIDAAIGTYVQFVDNDDILGDEALERLADYGDANEADVVVGKEVRTGTRWSLWPLFGRNRPHASLANDPLVGLLTPHKMFRREFLNRNGLRFPEGKRRLEDHPFVMRSFFLAGTISVLADYPCYYWVQRSDRQNAGARQRDWPEWYGHMRDVLDVVLKYTEPGQFRDQLLSHWYKSKGLKLLGAGFAKRTVEDARSLFDAFSELTAERFPPQLDVLLSPVLRLRAILLRAGRFEQLWSLSELEAGLALQHRVEQIRAEDGQFVFTVRAGLHYADGAPVMLVADGDRLRWDSPIDLGDDLPAEALDFTDAFERRKLDVVAYTRGTADPTVLPARSPEPGEHADGPRRFEAVVDARMAPVRMPEDRRRVDYDLHARLSAGGWTARNRLSPPAGAQDGELLSEPIRGSGTTLAARAHGDRITVVGRPTKRTAKKATATKTAANKSAANKTAANKSVKKATAKKTAKKAAAKKTSTKAASEKAAAEQPVTLEVEQPVPPEAVESTAS